MEREKKRNKNEDMMEHYIHLVQLNCMNKQRRSLKISMDYQKNQDLILIVLESKEMENKHYIMLSRKEWNWLNQMI